MPHLQLSVVGTMGEKRAGIGPDNSIQPRAPKNVNPVLKKSNLK